MNIYEKLAEARKLVRKGNYKKDGTNDYSKYDYFTPEKIEEIVAEITEKTKTMCLCNLKRNEFGLYQELRFIDLEAEPNHKYVCAISKYLKGETTYKEMPQCTCDYKESKSELVFELATEKGEIKATNSAQQMGGTDTYSERYIKMKVFQIKDNNLDFDSQDNRAEKPKVGKTIKEDDF